MTEPFVPLVVPGEEVLAVGDERLLRQVPSYNFDPSVGRPSSKAFGPADADKGKPSFSRSSVVSAEEAFEWHQKNARSKSLGVWACTSADAHDAGTRSVDDSKIPPEPGQPKAPGHCYVDYRHLSKPEDRVLRGILLAKALERGPEYLPPA